VNWPEKQLALRQIFSYTAGPEKESSQNRAGGDSEELRFRTFVLILAL